MNEQELQETLSDPAVQRVARQLATLNLPADTIDEAAKLWAAANVYAWLIAWRGRQAAMVLRVWYFWDRGRRGGDVDLQVGHSGRDEQFKLLVTEIGPSALRVRIVKWVNGVESEVWSRAGFVHTEQDQYVTIYTLPVGR